MKHLDLNISVEGSLPHVKATLYLLDEIPFVPARPVVIICPGGAYAFVSEREAEPIAMKFCAMGYHAAVLDYSVAPARFPTAFLEVGTLVKTLRENHEAWQIDPDRILLCGFSAGGHLAASFATLWHEPWAAQALGCSAQTLKPNGLILAYPVISSGEEAHTPSFENLLGERYEEMKDALSLENRVTEHTPPTFIWHTFQDALVPVSNSIRMAAALAKAKIPVEFHLFPQGAHGLSLSTRLTPQGENIPLPTVPAQWIDLVHTWIEGQL